MLESTGDTNFTARNLYIPGCRVYVAMLYHSQGTIRAKPLLLVEGSGAGSVGSGAIEWNTNSLSTGILSRMGSWKVGITGLKLQ